MEAIVIPKEIFETVVKDLKEMKKRLNDLTSPHEHFIDNKTFMKLMGVSRKTALDWRNEGKIGYTKEGNKIYYRMTDIHEFLKRFHYKPFAEVEHLI